MTQAVRQRFDFTDYVLLEESSTVKHEYLDGGVWAMAGGSPDHARITANVASLLRAQLSGRRCAVFSSDLRVRVKATGLTTYPDVTVVCDPSDTNSRFVERPCLVVEVLSPSTQHKDRREKLLLYRNIESMRSYLIVAPDEGWIELHERHADGMWRQHRVEGDEKLALPCVDAAIATHELFLNLQSEQ